ncbi:major facilitator superfamily MFS_1 domain protein [Burkholderia oklahomensis]|uniref:Major facilitator superfamily MFS_1 domain protein n=1 Tax=Burkholderia oklahomensis TaxID=342113 RepID=A0AAI8FQ76_9BURK|nr:major facilitator superfamily MFS_1 domain protein [Burkholderia oklahomensis]
MSNVEAGAAGRSRCRRPSTPHRTGPRCDPRVWKLRQYDSITFGGFTALSLWIPQYPKSGYGMSLVAASAFAAGSSLPGSVLRALVDLFRVRSTCFMFLYGIVWVSLIILYLSGIRRVPVPVGVKR